MRIICSILLLFLALSGFSQGRPTPVENLFLRTDADANFKNITNVNSVVFYKSGTNLVVDLNTFLNLFKGEAKKLIDQNNVSSYLFVSNSRPYLLTVDGLQEVTLSSDRTFIRQNDSLGTVTNMNVLSELKIMYPSTIDDSEYSVTYPALTNGAITSLRIGKYLFKDTSSGLVVSNIQTGASIVHIP